MGDWKVPGWVMATLVVATFFNVLISVSIGLYYWRPDMVTHPITPDVALGLHLQLFEAFLGALGIGLGIMGFVGFSAIRNAAVSAAVNAVETTAQLQKSGYNDTQPALGSGDRTAKVTREREDDGL